MRYVCTICGYVYDEAEGGPWSELPKDWRCPVCRASKSEFAAEGATGPKAEVTSLPVEEEEMKEHQ